MNFSVGLFLVALLRTWACGGFTSGLQWALPPPPPQFNSLPPPPVVLPPQFLFAQALLPKYNEVKGVDGWILLRR